MFVRQYWSLTLTAPAAADVPVPTGRSFWITGVQALDFTVNKIVLELTCAISTADLPSDKDGATKTDVLHAVIAVLFPRVQSSAELQLAFSGREVVSLTATGGPVTVTGFWCYDEAFDDDN
jgi:hypothetical protein